MLCGSTKADQIVNVYFFEEDYPTSRQARYPTRRRTAVLTLVLVSRWGFSVQS
jgi:hypothetical protein